MRDLAQFIHEAAEGKETFEVVYPDGTMHSFYYSKDEADACIKDLEKENPDPKFKPTIRKGNDKNYTK